MNEPFSMRPIYELLLRGSTDMPIGLYHLHLATAGQLVRLHYSPSSYKPIRQRLKVLADNGYVQIDAVPAKYARGPNYYTLGTKGVEYLASVGYDTKENFRASKEIKKYPMFIDHTIELNDVLISAALLHKTQPRYTLYSFLHERFLKKHPYQVRGLTIIPDAFLDFHMLVDGKLRRMPVLLEHDRGTEQQEQFRKRIQVYIQLIKTGSYQGLFDTKAITIAFTTFEGFVRLKQMIQWTLAELQHEPAAIGGVFLFATFERPLEPGRVWLEPCWYTPYYSGQAPIALLGE